MINCMVLDDDPSVLAYMRVYIEKTPFLNLIATHITPNDALTTLEATSIQLIFMDIDLPGITGIEFSKMLNTVNGKTAPRIVLISSTDSYALEGYKVNAIDYLLKPLTYEDFFKAAFKAKAIIEAPKTTVEVANVVTETPKKSYTDGDYIFLRVDYDLVKVYLKDILYFEGFSNYIKIHTINEPFLLKSLTTIKSFEEKLPADAFIRVHRSFIVSVDKIESINKKSIKIGRANIPITDQYKERFKAFVDQLYL